MQFIPKQRFYCKDSNKKVLQWEDQMNTIDNPKETLRECKPITINPCDPLPVDPTPVKSSSAVASFLPV